MKHTQRVFEQEGAERAEMNRNPGLLMTKVGSTFSALSAISCSILLLWLGCVISERTEGRLPALAEVRDVVRREWDNARRLDANEKFYQELLKRYTVTIESPEPEKKLAEARR